MSTYSDVLASWQSPANPLWPWLIISSLLMLLIPGAIAFVTEEPRPFGRTRQRPRLVPTQPQETDELDHPIAPAA